MTPRFEEQVGLALRAFRRSKGWSQRAFAREVGVPASTVARVERSASGASLTLVLCLLEATGHTLGVVDATGAPASGWAETDLVARDRAGRRFPAHREVRPVRPGSIRPLWWTLHEYLGTGECRPQPSWTAEGFPVPDGTRFGREPRPWRPGDAPRWPHLPPELPPAGTARPA
jgi:transcriptional regulator with XRE-family HTH domain